MTVSSSPIKIEHHAIDPFTFTDGQAVSVGIHQFEAAS